MREIFTEGDLIAAAVQEVKHDGSILLQIRNTDVGIRTSIKNKARSKYGRLSHGQLVSIPSSLIKRQPMHFQTLESIGVDVILGMNGFVWVALPLDKGTASTLVPAYNTSADDDGDDDGVSREDREKIARVSQAIRALGKLYFMVHKTAIITAYELSVIQGVEIKDMVGGGFLKMLAEEEARGRNKDIGDL